MAKIRVTDLPVGTLPLAGDESLLVVQDGVEKQATVDDVILGLAPLESPTFTGTVTVPTPAVGTSAANKSYVDGVAAGVPSGVILPYGGASAPSADWLICDGTAVSRSTYAALFTAIGTAYGVGDGSTTFNIPDMRGAAPGGAGTSTGYTANETLTRGTKHNDQMQQITGDFGNAVHIGGSGTANGAFSTSLNTSGVYTSGASGNGRTLSFDSANSPGARTGTTTRGKLVGVNFIIKV